MSNELDITGDRGQFVITDQMLMSSVYSPRQISEMLEDAARNHPELIVRLHEETHLRGRKITWEPRF